MARYDIIILGAGPAGMAAALAADQNGARVLLAEKQGFVGGMSTEGLLNVFCGDASGALMNEFNEKLIVQVGNKRLRRNYDTEALKEYWLRRLLSSRIELLLHTGFFDAQMRGGEIVSVRLLLKSGLETHSAAVYIDCSGDGDLARACGVPYTLGRSGDGAAQPATLMVRLGGIRTAELTEHAENEADALQALLQEAVHGGRVPAPAGHVILIPEIRDGIVTLNMTNATGVNGTDSRSLTKAELTCRAQVKPLLDFVRAHVRGCENAYVLQTAAYTGARETRHFHGRHILHEDEMRASTIFTDWCVTHAAGGFNIHNMSGSGSDKTAKANPGVYTIPYRSLLPLGVNNLLLAGRCISGTHVAHGSYRHMPVCLATGQAAGTAAALAVQAGLRPAQLDVSALQATLLAQGVKAPDAT